MNLSELQSVQSTERQTDSLQRLRASFYADAGEFIAELRAERATAVEAAEDPFADDDVRRLTDDIETARSTVEAIYERRVGKVVRMASLAAADMPTEEEGLTDEEAALFEQLVGAIRDNRRDVMAMVDEDAGAGKADPSEHPPRGVDEPDVEAADLMGADDDAEADAGGSDEAEPPDEPPDAAAAGAGDEVREVPPAEGPPGPPPDEEGAAGAEASTPEADASNGGGSAGAEAGQAEPTDPEAADAEPPAEAAGDEADVRRTTVRITRDVGEIFGVDDRAYDLSTDDVVTLPAPNAEPLIAEDAAEPLE